MISNNDQTFVLSKGYKWLYLIGILLFGGGLVLSILLPYCRNNLGAIIASLFLTSGYGFFVWNAFQGWLRSYLFVQTDNSGITCHSKTAPSIFIAWDNIARLRGNYLRQCLEVRDGFGQNTIYLDYHLNHFEDLRTIIHENAKLLRVNNSTRKQFFISRMLLYSFSVVIPGVFLVFALIIKNRQGVGNKIFLVTFVLSAIFFFLISLIIPRKIVIASNSILIDCPIIKRNIPYSEVTNIILKNETAGRGQRVNKVIVEQTDGKTIRLSGFRNEEDAIYDSIRSAWEDYLKK